MNVIRRNEWLFATRRLNDCWTNGRSIIKTISRRSHRKWLIPTNTKRRLICVKGRRSDIMTPANNSRDSQRYLSATAVTKRRDKREMDDHDAKRQTVQNPPMNHRETDMNLPLALQGCSSQMASTLIEWESLKRRFVALRMNFILN